MSVGVSLFLFGKRFYQRLFLCCCSRQNSVSNGLLKPKQTNNEKVFECLLVLVCFSLERGFTKDYSCVVVQDKILFPMDF